MLKMGNHQRPFAKGGLRRKNTAVKQKKDGHKATGQKEAGPAEKLEMLEQKKEALRNRCRRRRIIVRREL